MRQRKPTHVLSATQDGMEETLRLYHAWLALLLEKLHTQEIRVGVGELKEALKQCRCSVSKEGDDYVIQMGEGEDE